MVKSIVLPLLLLSIFLPALSEGSQISGPEVRLVNNDIYVSFSLSLDDKSIQEIKNGIDKELRFYIDLFKVWKAWPDEFVLGKLTIKNLKADPIKKEYVATSNDGSLIVEKRFRSFESMMGGTSTVKDLKLTNTRELEPGQYFVRITIESRVRKLPPIIGQILIFVPEHEFRIRKDSGMFLIEGPR